jgi:plastocyanin
MQDESKMRPPNKEGISLIVFLILLMGCFGQNTQQQPTTDEIRVITVKLTNFKITPSILAVERGEKIQINVVNVEGEHNLFMEGYNLKTEIVNGSNTQVIEFKASQTGSFAFWCEVRDHRSRGMEGELIVQ